MIVNAWTGARSGERQGVFACDGCLPPHVMIASTAGDLAASGWRFEAFDEGAHYCPLCAQPPRAPRRRVAPQARAALPNLLIIGSGKCGTSSLHSYLAAHPEIQMSDVKELKFFLDPGCLRKLDAYATYFDAHSPIRGESTPSYSLHPLVPGVPERIRAAVPGARLIYLVRDPIDRTLSHFAERAQKGHRGSFEHELGDVGDPYNVYVAGGSYATQLERYLTVFPAERILVIDQADLLRDRRRTLREVFRFLNVGDDFWSPRYERVHNPRERKVRWSVTGRRLALSRTATVVRRAVPETPRQVLFAPAKRLTTRRMRRPELDDVTRERLRDAFLPEVARLRELTGKRFTSWQL